MGTYLNPGSGRFEKNLRGEIYVDKTGLINHLNSIISTPQGYISVSRPRRFGKTMAADMICAYYDRTNDSRALFENKKIAEKKNWDEYLNQLDVIRLVMTDFLNGSKDTEDMLSYLEDEVITELKADHPDTVFGRRQNLRTVMTKIYAETKKPYVIVIDEWDAIFRAWPDRHEEHVIYLDFLRNWLKDQEYVALAYMTGILPIKKYGIHSALNMFDEYSMTASMQLASYTGFTENEVKALCEKYCMKFHEIEAWYDGYQVSDWIPVEKRNLHQQGHYQENQFSIYSPLSVVKAMLSGEIQNYWNQTETFEALKVYIDTSDPPRVSEL